MMSEPGTNIEIEDVLSSIRRLVSQDAGLPRPSGVPHRTPKVVSVEADCLVLTPAQRVDEDEFLPEEEAEAPVAVQARLAPEDGPESAVPEVSEVSEVAADAAPAVTPPEADLPEDDLPEASAQAPALAEAPPAEVPQTETPQAETLAPPPAAEAAETVDMAEVQADLAETVGDDTMAATVDWADPAPEPEAQTAAEPVPMTEAEELLAEAEAALAGSGAVLENAESALDGAWHQADVAPEPEAGPDTADLGDELTRLESTIAELEAAVAESGVEFEPEEGHPFAAEGADPLRDLPESFAETDLGEAAEDAPLAWADAPAQPRDPVQGAGVAMELASEVEAAEQPDEAARIDPDLHDAAWAGADGAGMDWAEATLNLARRGAPRRLHLADADEALQEPEALRSSYDEMRAELAEDDDFDDGLLAEDAVSGFEDGVIDEEMLREMVAQLIREELRGTLGERITKNVRKLVRREIQRALMGQDFE